MSLEDPSEGVASTTSLESTSLLDAESEQIPFWDVPSTLPKDNQESRSPTKVFTSLRVDPHTYPESYGVPIHLYPQSTEETTETWRRGTERRRVTKDRRE